MKRPLGVLVNLTEVPRRNVYEVSVCLTCSSNRRILTCAGVELGDVGHVASREQLCSTLWTSNTDLGDVDVPLAIVDKKVHGGLGGAGHDRKGWEEELETHVDVDGV